MSLFEGCLEEYMDNTIKNVKDTRHFCKQNDQFNVCIMNVANAAKRCLKPNEQSNMEVVLAIADIMEEFICFKNGDHLESKVCTFGNAVVLI